MLKNDIKKIRTSRFHENVLIFIKDKIYLKSIYLMSFFSLLQTICSIKS